MSYDTTKSRHRRQQRQAAQRRYDDRMPDDDGRRCPECHSRHDGERAMCEDCRVREPDHDLDEYDPRGESEWEARRDQLAEEY